MANNFFDSLTRDREYARKTVPHLTDPIIRKEMPLDIVSRCHICGDSSTNPSKKRLGIYETPDNNIHVHCFKCDYSSPIGLYLKTYWPLLYRQYLFDTFTEKGIKSKKFIDVDVPEEEVKINIKNINDKLIEYDSLDTLNHKHPIFKYINHRQIPKDQWYRLGFTRRWKHLSNELSPNTFEKIFYEHPRLVIPAYDKRGNLKTLNGRAFTEDQIRYQIIKSLPASDKLFGEENVNVNKPNIFVLEGPLDSLFINNSLALSGAMVDLKSFNYPKDRRVFILDNEPRHPDTKKRIQKFIDNNERVVLWDKMPIKYKSCKDINAMVMAGWPQKEINEYLENNIISGLNAQLRFNYWSK